MDLRRRANANEADHPGTPALSQEPFAKRPRGRPPKPASGVVPDPTPPGHTHPDVARKIPTVPMRDGWWDKTVIDPATGASRIERQMEPMQFPSEQRNQDNSEGPWFVGR